MASFKDFSSSIGKLKGSPLIGNPITVKVQAMSVSKSADDTLAFHRLIVEINAKLSTASSYTTFTSSTTVEDGEEVEFDISSALRAVADAYVFSPEPTTYPSIVFQIKAYDEYMLNGEMVTKQGTNYLPSSSGSYSALMGKFSDLERLKSGAKKSVKILSRKPNSSPQIIAVGESFAYTPSLSADRDFDSSVTPQSAAVTIANQGSQTIGGVSLFAVPASSDRYQLRFINGLGVLESISVYSLRETEVSISNNEYITNTSEDFNTFTRAIIRKYNDYETWKLTSGPLDKSWQSWFIHELLMSEFVWILIDNNWIRCHIIPDETVSGYSPKNQDFFEVQFSVRFDINGSLL